MDAATTHHPTHQAEICARTMSARLRCCVMAAVAGVGLFISVPQNFAAEEKSSKRIEDNIEYQAALRALSYGLPDVAALKWERLLKDANLTSKQAARVGERYVDALLRARQPDRAQLALTLYEIPEVGYWRGQCLLELQQFRDAEHSFKDYLATPNAKYRGEAQLSLGQVIIAQGRENTGRKEYKVALDHRDPVIARQARLNWNESDIASDRATVVLERLGDKESADAEVEFIRACAFLSLGDGLQAQRVLRGLLDSTKKTGERLHEATILRLAEAYAIRGRSNIAEKVLLEYLGAEIPGHYEESAFALLQKVAARDNEVVPKEMLNWARQPQPASRQALALYYYAEWLSSRGQPGEAIPFIDDFLSGFPGHPRESEALRLAMECHGAAGNDERVLELANLWKEKFSASSEGAVDFLTAMIRFSRKEFGESAKLFQQAADATADALQKQRAIYNQALAALRGGQPSVFESCRVQLQTDAAADKTTPEDNPAARLMIERALLQASERDADAEASLQEFIKTYPSHPRLTEAHVALAEYCLLAVPPRPKAAEAALSAARKIEKAPNEWKERVDYMEIWVRETDADLEGTAAQGLAFINQWPMTARRDEVRMKVAQAYYRLEEYTKALAQFDLLAEEKTDSPYAEAARFFAGKSAMALMSEKGLDQAIELWRQVAEGGGPLAMEARRQQALAKRRQGKDSDALAVIDSLLTGKPAPEREMRFALLMEKGEMLFGGGAQSAKNLEDAAAIFQSIRQDTTAPRTWRERSGVLLAQCYERMGKTSEALEACHDVVESTLSGDVTKLTPSDYLWLYRAGFFALDLLEGKKEWIGAARLADRLAQAGGERAEEAKKRSTKIKTEHFIWDK